MHDVIMLFYHFHAIETEYVSICLRVAEIEFLSELIDQSDSVFDDIPFLDIRISSK